MITASQQSWERNLYLLAEEARHPATTIIPRPVKDAALLERAYARCEEVIAEHGKTFNLASRLLPPAKRRAIRALYAFCRVSDNIVDCGDDGLETKEAQMAAWRHKATSAYPPDDDLVATAWADTRLRYDVPYMYAEQLIDGVALDLHKRRYNTFDELATYAYGVASTVGLMSMRIIGLAPGYSEEEAIPFVIRLGIALQVTNILRDVGEDLAAGRLYLPQAELASFGLTAADLEEGRVRSGPGKDSWREFMRFQIARNRELYSDAWPCVQMFDHDGRFAVAAACSLYRSILEGIEDNDYDVFSHRAHISTWGKLRRLPGVWWRNR